MAYKKKKYSAEERAAFAEKKKSEMDEMIQRIDEGVKAVFESERYKEYLKFASKFTDYSARNTMLINMQRPDATLVAAFGKWKLLDNVEKRPVRLIGVGIYDLSGEEWQQLTLFDLSEDTGKDRSTEMKTNAELAFPDTIFQNKV